MDAIASHRKSLPGIFKSNIQVPSSVITGLIPIQLKHWSTMCQALLQAGGGGHTGTGTGGPEWLEPKVQNRQLPQWREGFQGRGEAAQRSKAVGEADWFLTCDQERVEHSIVTVTQNRIHGGTLNNTREEEWTLDKGVKQ